MNGPTLDYLARLAAWAFALCLTEGFVIAASWWLWARASRRAPAGPRHRLACAHLAGFTVLPALSLIALQGFLVLGGTAADVQADAPGAAAHAGGGMLALMPMAACIWLAGAAVCAVRLVAAWRETRRVRRAPAPGEVTAAMVRLARTIGLRRAPDVASADVATPQVIGAFRPILLVPADLGARLTARQLDAVLLHELAHVRHGDFGWNILQRSLLILVWFHPGAWWVYAAVRREREMRCDAQAARRLRSGADLAMALVTLAETVSGPRAAVALSAASADLETRVICLVAPAPADRPWVAAAPAAAAAGLIALAVAAGAGAQFDSSLRARFLESAFSQVAVIQARDPAGEFQVRILNGRVLAAAMGPKAVPARIIQRGRTVTLIDRSGGPILAVTITPRGGIQWRPRRSASAG